MPLTFDDWKHRLLDAAGCASPSVRQLGDYVLELFWKDGCEPTMRALLDYAQAGLCGHFNVQVGEQDVAEQINRALSYRPSAPPR